MTIRRVRQILYTAAGMGSLALGGCAGVAPPPPATGASSSSSATCAMPAPNLRAAYNRPYQTHGRHYAPLTSSTGYAVRGMASWYGWESGSTTAMGTPFRPRAFSAASSDLPLPTCARVTNLSNGRSIVVLINDRGPFVDGRIMDLSYGAANALGMTGQGTAPVQIVALPPAAPPPASTAGSTSTMPPLPMAPEMPAPSQSFLQTGAFSQVNNATRERDRLLKAGIHGVLIVPGLVKGRSYYKVQIGPLPDGITAIKVIAELKQMGFHGFYSVEQ